MFNLVTDLPAHRQQALRFLVPVHWLQWALIGGRRQDEVSAGQPNTFGPEV